jgi:hypothetical protein
MLLLLDARHGAEPRIWNPLVGLVRGRGSVQLAVSWRFRPLVPIRNFSQSFSAARGVMLLETQWTIAVGTTIRNTFRLADCIS